jgi:transposase IS66 family protein
MQAEAPREHPCTPHQRLQIRAEQSASVVEKFHAWLEALAPQVLPQSLLGKAVYYTLGQWPKCHWTRPDASQLPYAKKLEDFDALLPWNVKHASPTS